MAKHKAINNYHIDNKKISSSDSGQAWQFLIDQAEAQIQIYETMAARLKGSIDYFAKCKSRGDYFPGNEKLRELGLIS